MSVYKVFTQLMKDPLNPKCLRVFSMKFYSKESKAFVKSTKTRGIRPGYPLSALLFVLSVEIMASRLRNNKDIKRFQIKIDEKTHSIKISQLADDTTLF
jgi:hypothetical protein